MSARTWSVTTTRPAMSMARDRTQRGQRVPGAIPVPDGARTDCATRNVPNRERAVSAQQSATTALNWTRRNVAANALTAGAVPTARSVVRTSTITAMLAGIKPGATKTTCASNVWRCVSAVRGTRTQLLASVSPTTARVQIDRTVQSAETHPHRR